MYSKHLHVNLHVDMCGSRVSEDHACLLYKPVHVHMYTCMHGNMYMHVDVIMIIVCRCTCNYCYRGTCVIIMCAGSIYTCLLYWQELYYYTKYYYTRTVSTLISLCLSLPTLSKNSLLFPLSNSSTFFQTSLYTCSFYKNVKYFASTCRLVL